MNASLDWSSVDRFTAGAIGEPGARTFFVQARAGARQVTLVAEKEQVALLAQALGQLVSILPPGEEGPEPPGADLDLVQPLDAAWRIGEIAIQYLEDVDRIAVVCEEAVESDDESDDEEPAIARFVVTRAQARAVAGHALAVVAAGRPRCQFCGNPLEKDVPHACVAGNGHRGARKE